MNKIIGFTISKSHILHDDVDIFNAGLTKAEFRKNNFNIYLWGIGEITQCVIDGKYSLSLPLNDNLLDRNVLFYFSDSEIIVENDWLGSIPVFYNNKDLIVSTLCRKALKDKIIHPEGLNNYFRFGYSVFEQTPFLNVKFLRYFSKLTMDGNGIKIECKNDLAIDTIMRAEEEDEREVLIKIDDYLDKIEDISDGSIILPTSGGFDSRLLNYFVEDKSRILSFTYGISKNQSKSYEVVYAKKLSDKLGTKWQQVELGYFYKYINEWFALYGFSTHLHGMHHVEFYKKILDKNRFGGNTVLLSAIIGDGWAGSIAYGDIKSKRDLIKVGYAHGYSLDEKKFVLKDAGDMRQNFFLQHAEILKNNKVKALFTLRLKLILLSYLTQVPEYFGFPALTPFLNFDITISMLNIAEERRKDRIWQKEFFKKKGLYFEDMKLVADHKNCLDYRASLNYDFEPIDLEQMDDYLDRKYLKKVNQNILNKQMPVRLKNRILSNEHIRKIAREKLDIKALDKDYFIIKPIEMVLRS